MFKLAIRQILFEPLKSGLIILAIAAVIATILILHGFENGFYEQARRFVEDRNTLLFVAQSGVSDLLGDRSSLAQKSRQMVEEVPGVKAAYPVTSFPIIYKHNEHRAPVMMWIYDQKGGPTNIAQGRAIQEAREAIIDWALAKKFGLKIGDDFIVSDFAFKIVGISENTTVMSSPVVFVNYDGLIDFFFEADVIADVATSPLLSHLLVDLKDGADPKKVKTEIESKVPGVSAWTKDQVVAADIKLLRGIFEKVVGLLVKISYLIGILVIGLICFADVTNRLRTFAILKALGFQSQQLVSGIAIQTILLLIIAFPVGVLLAKAIGSILETWRPQFLIAVLVPEAIISTLVAAFILAIIGSLLPMRSIVKTDPATAFRGN